MQQKSVHISLLPSLFLMTDSILLSMEDTRVAHISGEIFCHSSKTIYFYTAFCWRGSVALPFSVKYPNGVLMDSSQEGHSMSNHMGSHLKGFSFFWWKMNQCDGEIPNIRTMGELFMKLWPFTCVSHILYFILYSWAIFTGQFLPD